MEGKFCYLSDYDINRSIHELANQSSKLKAEIFKAVIMAKDVDKKNIQFFLGSVNGFLRDWTSFAEDLTEKIKGAKGVVGCKGLEYSVARDYIYAKYDYASLLQFVDGVIQGITSEKFTEEDDINDFFEHVVSKAFKNRADSTAGLLDEVCRKSDCGPNYDVSIDTAEAKKFDSIRNYDIFDKKDRKEIYKSIEKTIEFMTIDMNHHRYSRTKDVRLFVCMINNVVEYMNYILTAYATRIYLIAGYAYPHIVGSNTTSSVESVNESVDEESGEGSSNTPVTVMLELDDADLRDPDKITDLVASMDKFLKIIGADNPNHGETYRRNLTDEEANSNMFCSRVMANDLYMYLKHNRYVGSLYGDNMEVSINEMKNNLKQYMYNSTQGLQGTNSPKQEILHVIRGIVPKNETSSEYIKLGSDLYQFSINLLFSCQHIYEQINKWRREEITYPKNNVLLMNSATELAKLAKELYGDIAIASVQRGREIEMMINHLRNVEFEKLSHDLTIKVPGMKSDISRDAVMAGAVPDTTRLPTELLDLYAKPSYEAMMLYDEYVHSLPGMENDPYYYSEGVGESIAEFFRAILSKIRGLKKKFVGFLDNQEVKKAFSWVKDHKNDLLSMDFTGVTLKMKPYKVKIDEIFTDEKFNKLTNGLNNFTMDNAKDKASIDAYIKSLYPDDTIWGWFQPQGNEKPGDAAQRGANKYRNFILFNDENQVQEQDPAEVELTGTQIHNAMASWITTFEGVDKLRKNFSDRADSLDKALQDVQKKFVESQNKQQQEQQQQGNGTAAAPAANGTNNSMPGATGTGAPPSSLSGAGSAASGTGAGTNGEIHAGESTQFTEADDQNKDNANQITETTIRTEIQTVIDRLWTNVEPMLTEYLRTMYQYLNQAFDKGKKV